MYFVATTVCFFFFNKPPAAVWAHLATEQAVSTIEYCKSSFPKEGMIKEASLNQQKVPRASLCGKHRTKVMSELRNSIIAKLTQPIPWHHLVFSHNDPEMYLVFQEAALAEPSIPSWFAFSAIMLEWTNYLFCLLEGIRATNSSATTFHTKESHRHYKFHQRDEAPYPAVRWRSCLDCSIHGWGQWPLRLNR